MIPNFDELDNIGKIEDDVDDIPINTTLPPNDEPNASEGEEPGFGPSKPADVLIEKTKTKLQISRRKELFGNYLKGFGDRLDAEKLELLSATELKQLLDEVRVTIGCRHSASMITTSYIQYASLVENIAPSFGLNLTNLKNHILNNEQLLETLTEVSLEYEDFAYISPLPRLALQTCNLIFGLHTHNKKLEEEKLIDNAAIPNTIIDNFSDL
jgi:hypothetical protein